MSTLRRCSASLQQRWLSANWAARTCPRSRQWQWRWSWQWQSRSKIHTSNPDEYRFVWDSRCMLDHQRMFHLSIFWMMWANKIRSTFLGCPLTTRCYVTICDNDCIGEINHRRFNGTIVGDHLWSIPQYIFPGIYNMWLIKNILCRYLYRYIIYISYILVIQYTKWIQMVSELPLWWKNFGNRMTMEQLPGVAAAGLFERNYDSFVAQDIPIYWLDLARLSYSWWLIA